MKDLTTILIPVFNCADYTKQCLDSILKNTRSFYDILIINNGSTDHTKDILASVSCIKQPNLRNFEVIENKENLGVVKAFNQGIDSFKGDHLLLLNNDCIVTSGWLENMLNAYSHDSCIGIVGPCTNTFDDKDHPHHQLIQAGYKNLSDLERFAARLRQEKSGKICVVQYVFGHCMLVKRPVIDAVGKFDEIFGIGYFEEIDFCQNAVKKGYRVAVALDSFVHHFGNVTLDYLGIDREQLKEKNRKIYSTKHGVDFNDQL